VGKSGTLVNNITTNYPATSASGELLLMFVITYRNSATAYTHTTPTNWSLLARLDRVSTAGQIISVYSRVRGAETSVNTAASVTLYWHNTIVSLKDFYAADPIEAVGTPNHLVGDASSIDTPALPVGSPSGVVYWGGGGINSVGALTQSFARGQELTDDTVNPSSPAITLSLATAFENVSAAGVVGANTITHSTPTVQDYATAVAVRPSSWVEPAPTLASSSPSSASTTGGASITLTGTGFKGTGATTETVVKVDGVAVPAANINVQSATSLTFAAPAHAAGTATVTVTTSKGTSNSLSLLYAVVTLTPQGMSKSASQSLTAGSFTGADNKLTGFTAQSGTAAGSVVNNGLVVNGDGNITVDASAAYSTVSSSCRLDIWKNGVRVSTTTSATSATWTGDVVQGDVLELHVWRTTTSGRTVSSASLAYTVNATPVLVYSYDFPEGTGPLDTTYWTTDGGGTLKVTNGELDGTNTPSVPLSFAWWKQPMPTDDYEVTCRIRWNGRNPEHSTAGIAVRADPFQNPLQNPGVEHGVMVTPTVNLEAMYYEDYDQSDGNFTGLKFATGSGGATSTTKYPDNSLLSLRVQGTTYTYKVNGVVKKQGTVSSSIIPTNRRMVGLFIQDDFAETGGGDHPAMLDEFRAYAL